MNCSYMASKITLQTSLKIAFLTLKVFDLAMNCIFMFQKVSFYACGKITSSAFEISDFLMNNFVVQINVCF